jgi:hypothetical protein
MTTTRYIELTTGTKTSHITLSTRRTLAEIYNMFRLAVANIGGNPAHVACWQAQGDSIAHVDLTAMPSVDHRAVFQVLA